MWPEELERRVRELLKDDQTGHGIDHCYKVLDKANIIALGEGEPVDSDVIFASGFLHDIAYAYEDSNDPLYKNHPERSVPIAKKELKKVGCPEEKIDLTLEVIKLHDDPKPWGKHRKSESREVLYIQDADGLEAIGAIGIMRLAKYGYKINMPIYIPNLPFNDANAERSIIHNIYIHAKEIPKYLNTETAKELAKPRVEFMEKYVDMFKLESFL